MSRTLLSFFALALLPASALATEVGLYSGTGDGYATFNVDEFGAIDGCYAGGVTFDPIGTESEQQLDCQTFTYLFDQAGTTRQPLIDNFWPRETRCPNVYDSETAADATLDVSADATWALAQVGLSAEQVSAAQGFELERLARLAWRDK